MSNYKIKLLYFASSKNIGLTTHLTEYAIGLKKLGVDVTVIANQYPIKPHLITKLDDNSIGYHFMDRLEDLNPFYFFKNIYNLINLINNFEINIIQCQGFINLLLAYISKIFSSRKPKIVVYFHAFPQRYFMTPPKSRLILPILLNFYNKFSDGILAVSEQTHYYLLKHGSSPKKTFVVYNSLNFKRIYEYKSREISDLYIKNIFDGLDCPYIVYVAQLKYHKGHKTLLLAAKKVLKEYKDLKFLIIGKGPLEGELIDLSKDLKINENVIFTGYLEYEDTIKLVSKAYAVVIPSYAETFSHALVEAMALEIPVISTRVGIAETVINDGENGFLVSIKDSDDIYSKLVLLLENKNLAHKMGKSGQKIVEKKFEISNISKTLISIYLKLIERGDIHKLY